MKQFLLYFLRWQLSTLILAPCIYLLSFNSIIVAIISNAIGASIFFWVDKYIFKQPILFPIWQIQEEVKCADCGKVCRGYRLVKTKNYDRIKDKEPEFRCEKCSEKKIRELKSKGIEY